MMRILREFSDRYGLWEPPIEAAHQKQLLGAFLSLGAAAELVGPLADVLLWLAGVNEVAFHRTSIWNLSMFALFAGLRIASSRLTTTTLVRILAYTALLIGIPAMHQLGGPTAPVILFLAVPILIGTFFLGFREGVLICSLALASWLGVVAATRLGVPPPPAPQGELTLHLSYGISGIVVIWAIAVGFFSAHRKSDRQRRENEAELGRALADLKRQAGELHDAVAARDAFLATVSHELRTPITSIYGLAELARANDGTLGRQQGLQLGATAAQLRQTVENLLDMARLKSGDQTPVSEPVELGELLRDLRHLFAPVLELHRDRDVELVVKTSGLEAGTAVATDAGRLHRILANLVANALKATEAGTVTIDANLSPAPDGRTARLELAVIDTGCGFDPSELRRPAGETTDTGLDLPGHRLGQGLGLGLQLVHRMVDQLDGHFRIASARGAGTRCTLVLDVPLVEGAAGHRAQADDAVPPAAPAADRPLELVIVDDNDQNRELFRQYCEVYGWQARLLASAGELLGFADDELAAFDLILLDLLMPGMDGNECAAVLRERGGGLPPVVALTAHLGHTQERDLMGGGFDGIIHKPLGLAEFESAIRGYVDGPDADRRRPG